MVLINLLKPPPPHHLSVVSYCGLSSSPGLVLWPSANYLASQASSPFPKSSYKRYVPLWTFHHSLIRPEQSRINYLSCPTLHALNRQEYTLAHTGFKAGWKTSGTRFL